MNPKNHLTPTHRAGKREPSKLTLLWLFHKFGFLKKQKFEKILILSISWSFENFDFFPRIEFYIFLRRFQTVPGGWPRLGISSWWNHIWNIFGTNFPPNRKKIDQWNRKILTQSGLDGKVHPASPNLEFKGSIDIITGTKSPTNLITAYLNRPKIESETEAGPEKDFMILIIAYKNIYSHPGVNLKCWWFILNVMLDFLLTNHAILSPRSTNHHHDCLIRQSFFGRGSFGTHQIYFKIHNSQKENTLNVHLSLKLRPV